MKNKYVMLYPGQGSQQPGMGQFLFNNFKLAEQTFEEASDAIQLNLKKLCFEGPESELALTENTQPALLCVSTALDRILKAEYGIQIQAAAGHSIGEYAAMVSAGVFPFELGMQAVRLRGKAMQSAVPVGAGGMLAVLGLDSGQVQELCKTVVEKSGFSPLSPANDNCPGQIVISGNKKAIEWLIENFKPEMISGEVRRAKFIPLAVSAPFHCAMMLPAEKVMGDFFSSIEFMTPQFPIVQNYTAKFVTDPSLLKSNLINQISAPVLWTQSMQTLIEKDFTQCVECGHGKVLNGLLKKINSEKFHVININSIDDLKSFADINL